MRRRKKLLYTYEEIKLIEIEITKKEKQDAEFKRSGGETVDYLTILAQAFVRVCEDDNLPVADAIKAAFNELDEVAEPD